MSSQTSSKQGLSLPIVLFVVFLILKLTNVITWSWWWVTAPLWITAGLGLGVFLASVGVFTMLALFVRRNS